MSRSDYVEFPRRWLTITLLVLINMNLNHATIVVFVERIFKKKKGGGGGAANILYETKSECPSRSSFARISKCFLCLPNSLEPPSIFHTHVTFIRTHALALMHSRVSFFVRDTLKQG